MSKWTKRISEWIREEDPDRIREIQKLSLQELRELSEEMNRTLQSLPPLRDKEKLLALVEKAKKLKALESKHRSTPFESNRLSISALLKKGNSDRD